MKVAVAHGPGNNVQELRQVLHGAGAQCAAEDCVLWTDLAARLGRSDVDLIVVQAAEAVDWSTINEAKTFSSAPMIAVGPNGNTEAAARSAGIAEYITSDHLQGGLDELLGRMVGGGAIRCKRGAVFAVLAPTGGNGGTFVATNLAAHFVGLAKGETAFVDVTTGFSKVGLALDLEPEHTLEYVCGRMHRLDRVSLLSYFHEDKSGLRLLYGEPESSNESYLDSDAVRKLTILSRMSAGATVFHVGANIRQPQVDAMRLADRVVLVVRPDVPSLNRAALAMEHLDQWGVPAERIRVVVNFWGEPGLASRQHIEETLHWKDAFYLAYDPGRVNRSTNEGLLLKLRYPRCRVSRQLAKLAQTLLENH